MIELILKKTSFFENYQKIDEITKRKYLDIEDDDLNSKIDFIENLCSNGISNEGLELYLYKLLNINNFLSFEKYLFENIPENVVDTVINNEVYKIYKQKYLYGYDVDKLMKYITPELFFLNIYFIMSIISKDWKNNSNFIYIDRSISYSLSKICKILEDSYQFQEPIPAEYIMEFFFKKKNIFMSLFFSKESTHLYPYVKWIKKYNFYELYCVLYDEISIHDFYLIKNMNYDFYCKNMDMIIFNNLSWGKEFTPIIFNNNLIDLLTFYQKISHKKYNDEIYIELSNIVSNEFRNLIDISEKKSVKLLKRIIEINNPLVFKIGKIILLIHGYKDVADFLISRKENVFRKILYNSAYTRNLDLIKYLYEKYDSLRKSIIPLKSCNSKLKYCNENYKIPDEYIKFYSYSEIDIIKYYSQYHSINDGLLSHYYTYQYPSIVKFMIENKTFNCDYLFLQEFIFHNILKIILNHIILNNDQKNKLLFHYALYNGNYYTMKILIDNGAKIDRYSKNIKDKYMIKLIQKHFPKAKRCNIHKSEYIDYELVKYETLY